MKGSSGSFETDGQWELAIHFLDLMARDAPPHLHGYQRDFTGNPKYNRNIIEYKDRGRYILILFLLCSWGSLCGFPSKVPCVRTMRWRFPKIRGTFLGSPEKKIIALG